MAAPDPQLDFLASDVSAQSPHAAGPMALLRAARVLDVLDATRLPSRQKPNLLSCTRDFSWQMLKGADYLLHPQDIQQR